jgi:hypothetical protein
MKPFLSQLKTARFYNLTEYQLFEEEHPKRQEWSMVAMQWERQYHDRIPGFAFDTLQDDIAKEIQKFSGYSYPADPADEPTPIKHRQRFSPLIPAGAALYTQDQVRDRDIAIIHLSQSVQSSHASSHLAQRCLLLPFCSASTLHSGVCLFGATTDSNFVQM